MDSLKMQDIGYTWLGISYHVRFYNNHMNLVLLAISVLEDRRVLICAIRGEYVAKIILKAIRAPFLGVGCYCLRHVCKIM